MKRRSFIQKAGLGASALVLKPGTRSFEIRKNHSDIPVLREVKTLDDIVTKEGHVLIRLEFKNEEPAKRTKYKTSISVDNGNILGIKEYFFEADEDHFNPEKNLYEGIPGGRDFDVLVVRLDEFTSSTRLNIRNGRGRTGISLAELVSRHEIRIEEEKTHIVINYLLDKEIGAMDLSVSGINDQGNEFSFAIMADPQGGNPEFHESMGTRLKIHNAWVEESVRIVNEMDPQPLFTLMLGDIVDGQGPEEYILQMESYFKKLNTPILYEIGNHESKYSASFEPGYNHESLRNYYEAQYRVNGTDKLLYSFDLGKWHFIVWPDPLRGTFWRRHPHYFEWLERDLDKNRDKPVMVFQHVPAHPIGIDPLTEYAESPNVKRTFTDILARHGNVKYVFSGHVHIPLKASIKTAVDYKGMKFINLPAAGYRPRAFGEQDLYGGPTQGVAFVSVSGSNAVVDFKTVTEDVYRYPEKMRSITQQDYPLWYYFRWELPKNNQLENGNFQSGLEHWIRRFVYEEDVHPSNKCEVTEAPERSTEKALYLYSAKREFDTAGQDRLPQTLNRVAQVIGNKQGTYPLLSLEYMPDPDNFDPATKNGIFLWLEAYEKSTKRINITYSAGYHFWNLESNYSQHKLVSPVRMEILGKAGEWHKLRLNPVKDFVENTEMELPDLENIDRFIINMGVWTINDGYRQRAAAWFSGLELNSALDFRSVPSLLDGREIRKKDDKLMIWGGADHLAGEHILNRTDMNWYGK